MNEQGLSTGYGWIHMYALQIYVQPCIMPDIWHYFQDFFCPLIHVLTQLEEWTGHSLAQSPPKPLDLPKEYSSLHSLT